MKKNLIPAETTTTIYRGRPRSNYFVLPVVPGQSPGIGSEVVSINPRTREKVQTICRDYFTYLWKDIPNSFCLLNYGITKAKLRQALEEKFPEFRGTEQFRFLMLEAIETENQVKD